MSSTVIEMNPLALAELELAAYFEAAAGDVGFRAQNPNPDRFGGVFDEWASTCLHLSKLRLDYRAAVENVRMVEIALGAVDATTRQTLVRGFERRGYAYRTELGGLRLWEAFRREASNVGLLGLVLETRIVFDRYLDENLRARARAAKDGNVGPDFDAESAVELLGFVEATAVRAYERWDAKRPPSSTPENDPAAWMRWLPRWFSQAKHAADRRLVGALRVYDDVRRARVDWEHEEHRRRERIIREARLERLVRLAGGAHG